MLRSSAVLAAPRAPDDDLRGFRLMLEARASELIEATGRFSELHVKQVLSMATGRPHQNDISLPVSGLEAFCDELEALLAKDYAGWELCLFGHLGDGNLHVNIMKPDALEKAAFLERTHACDADVFRLVNAHQGSTSAEPGIGLLKKDFLGYSRTPLEVAMTRQLKASLDPKGLLNPGKVL